MIGGTGKIPQLGDTTDAKIIVAANGGSDLIYVPDHDAQTVQAIVAFLRTQNYTGGLFVDDFYGSIPGSLPLSSIGLKGDTPLPAPAIAINFRNFATDPKDPNQTRVEIADTGLQEGQGMHGSFSRADTFNNMAAFGPDFKQGYTDYAPVSNGDITPTLAKLLGFDLPSNGELQGRVLREALIGGPDVHDIDIRFKKSRKADGVRTVLVFQRYGGVRYYDSACLVSSLPHQWDNDDDEDYGYSPCQ